MWSSEKIEILKVYFPKEGASKKLCSLLGVTTRTIYKNAERLGVIWPERIKYWSEDQLKILIEEFPKVGNSIYLRNILNKSKTSINTKVKKLCLIRPDLYKDIGFADIHPSFVTRMKSNASIRNLEYSLSAEYLWNMFLSQGCKCALSGLELIMVNAYRSVGQTASLDRIDSNKGYVEGNVQWLHKDINIMKLDYPQDYFIKMCKLISNNQKQNS